MKILCNSFTDQQLAVFSSGLKSQILSRAEDTHFARLYARLLLLTGEQMPENKLVTKHLIDLSHNQTEKHVKGTDLSVKETNIMAKTANAIRNHKYKSIDFQNKFHNKFTVFKSKKIDKEAFYNDAADGIRGVLALQQAQPKRFLLRFGYTVPAKFSPAGAKQLEIIKLFKWNRGYGQRELTLLLKFMWRNNLLDNFKTFDSTGNNQELLQNLFIKLDEIAGDLSAKPTLQNAFYERVNQFAKAIDYPLVPEK